jgi:hypothetical protein
MSPVDVWVALTLKCLEIRYGAFFVWKEGLDCVTLTPIRPNHCVDNHEGIVPHGVYYVKYFVLNT